MCMAKEKANVSLKRLNTRRQRRQTRYQFLSKKKNKKTDKKTKRRRRRRYSTNEIDELVLAYTSP